MKKRIFALLLSLCALAALAIALPMTQASATTTVLGSGTCGATTDDNVTWSLDSDGTMTISGTGAMKDYTVSVIEGTITNDDRPWKDLVGMIKKLVVEDGVTQVGCNAFAQNATNLTSATFLGNVCIKSLAFKECSSLTSVIFGGDADLKGEAFTFTDSLASVYFFGNMSDNINEWFPNWPFESGVPTGCKFYGYADNTTLTTRFSSYFAALDLKITGGTVTKDFTYDGATGVLTILTPTPLEIANMDASTATTHRIVVADGISANITLAGVNIECSTASPFEITAGSTGNVTITLKDGTTNTLDAVNGNSQSGGAALKKEGGGTDIGKLTIQGETLGTGKLIAKANYGAAIGGNCADGNSATVSNITITGGNITATSFLGAGIGSGYSNGDAGDVSNIHISGGKIAATSDSGAGIGSGYGYKGTGDVSSIEISGGKIAAASSTGAGIGSGGSQTGGSGNVSNITISGGTVTAICTHGVGIGSGIGSSSGDVLNIVISGGSVKTTGITAIGQCNGTACTPTDGNGNAVTLYELATGGKAVTIGGKSYPTKHEYYNFNESKWETENKVYLYLTGTEQSITVGDTAYMISGSALVPLSGTCGATANDNVTWKFDAATGTLTIGGSGAMADYLTNQQPWVGFKDMIKKIVIEDGVTHIGNIAFYGCEKLTDVTFPKSIQSIGVSAFQDCDELTSVTFPGYVTSIGKYAFFSKQMKGKLESVTFAAGVGSIGEDAFTGHAFTSLTFTTDVGSIGRRAFGYCTELTSVTFSGKVGTITSLAFEKCDNLQTVTFYDNVGCVEANIFKECNKLESVTFIGEVESIDTWAFRLADKLKYICFFGEVQAINYDAFYDIKDTCVIYCYTDNSVLQNAKRSDSENVTVKPLNGKLDDITWKLTPDGTLTISGSGDLSSLTADTAPWKSLIDNGLAKNVVIDSNVTYPAALFGGYHTVTFNAGNSTVYTPVLVAGGETVPEPADPTRLGYSFAGWYNGDAKYDFTTKITADLNLTAKWEKPDYVGTLDDAQKDLQDAIEALEDAVAQNETDVTTQIANVNTAISNLQTALDGKASTDDLNTLRMTVSTIQTTIASIQDELTALDTEDDNLQQQINDLSSELTALQNDLTALKNKVTELETSIGKLQTAQTALEAALSNKAGKDELQTAVDNLNTAIDKLNTLETNLAGTDAALTKRIDDLIDGATGTLKDAEDRLATLEAGVADLGGQITNLEDAQKRLEQDLATKANAADVTKNVNALHDEIVKLTAALNDKASQTDYDTLSDAVAALQSAVATLNAAKNDYATADTALENRLNEAIKNANDAQDAVIKALTDRVTAAEDALKKLQSDKADADDLADAIKNLNDAITAAQTAAQTYADGKDKTLNQAITNAENTLKGLINDVQKNLDKAIADLNKAISDGDSDLSDKITALNTALENAKTALEKTDSDNKAELNKAISDAQTALQAAIDKVASDLETAKAELNAAIANGDKDLSDKITALNTALETAKTALEKADADNKTELNKAISDAQTALQTAIDKVASDLEAVKAELEAKDAELEAKNSDQDAEVSHLQTFITVVCVIACVSLAGNVAIVTTVFILKRKRTH